MIDIAKWEKRDSNLELLRIFGMFLIILYHSVGHAAEGYGKMLSEPFGLNTLVNIGLASWGQVEISYLYLLVLGS